MTGRPGTYVALVHHPVRGRSGETITTSVTNLDVHDVARAARTYGVRRYFVVTPIDAQRALVEHILGYWHEGGGARRVPERGEALSVVRAVASVDAMLAAIEEDEGAKPVVVTTAARSGFPATSYDVAREMVTSRDRPVLLMFGTGYGLADALIERADVHLAPIRPGGYNHLAVRSAVAIVLDRLFGDTGG